MFHCSVIQAVHRVLVGVAVACLVCSPASAQQSVNKTHAVFIGDSITANWLEYRPEFFRDNGFLARGVSGEASVGTLSRFRKDAVGAEPESILILIGANDVTGWGGRVTDGQFLKNVGDMVRQAQDNKIAVVVGSILPQTGDTWDPPNIKTAPRIFAINQKLKEWTAAEHITYADFWTALTLPDGTVKPNVLSGGLHPTVAGYVLMEPVAKAAIEKSLRNVP